MHSLISMTNLFGQVQLDADRLCEKVNLGLGSLLVNTKANYDREMKAARKASKRRYRGIIGASSGIGLALYLGYRYLSSTAPQSIFGTVMWGLVSALIGNAVGFLIARLRDTLPETTRMIRERLTSNLRDDVRKLLDLDVGSYRFEALNEASISNRLFQIYERVLSAPDYSWHAAATEYLRILRASHSECEALRGSYVAFIEEAHQQCGHYFTDASKNLEALNTVAGKIKERAIEPSFQLLSSNAKTVGARKKGD